MINIILSNVIKNIVPFFKTDDGYVQYRIDSQSINMTDGENLSNAYKKLVIMKERSFSTGTSTNSTLTYYLDSTALGEVTKDTYQVLSARCENPDSDLSGTYRITGCTWMSDGRLRVRLYVNTSVQNVSVPVYLSFIRTFS